MAKDCSSAAGECLQATVSGTTAVPRSGSSSVMIPVQHAVKDGSGCDVCIQQRQHSDDSGWEIPATKQRALEFDGALSGVGGGSGGGGSDDEPGGCYCCYNPCGGHSHPLPMAEVVSTRVVVAEGERDGLEVCGVFSHLQQQQQQPSADETTKKENLSALVAGIGGGDRCSGNNNKDSSSGGGGGGWLLLADAVGAPTYAATMMPVGDKGLPPEARPPWELAAAFKLVECESVLPSPPGEAVTGAAAAAAAVAAAVFAAAESSPRPPGRKRKASPGRRGRRRSSAGLPR